MKSILVMGGSDFIGSALSRHLIRSGYQVDILTKGNRPINYKDFKQHIICNRHDRNDIEQNLSTKNYEYIFDMTAHSKDEVKNLLDFIDTTYLKKYIVLSTGAVYKDSSKKAKEDFEKGDNNNLYREYYFFERISQEKPIPVPHGKNVMTQFIYIDDLVRVLESIIHKPHVREAYNVTNPQIISWQELIQTCGEVTGKSPIIKLVDINKIEYEERSYFPFKNIDYTLEIDKLIEHGLYIPNIFLREGLEKSYNWYLYNKPKLTDNKMDKIEDIIRIG
ncbi:MAG: NAD-dependent epimerase/dehydratase family protein [Romboutsia sp.]